MKARINVNATSPVRYVYERMFNPANSLGIYPSIIFKPKARADNSLTYEQVERRRKQLRKKNFNANVRYRKVSAQL